MKRFLIIFLVSALAALPLCGCKNTNETPDGNSSVIVNLSTPKQSETQNPSIKQEAGSQDRYYLKLATTETTDAGISLNAKLLVRYTNTTDSPTYSLGFKLQEGVSINSVSVNSIATNFTIDKESNTLTIPVGAQLMPNESLSLYVNYTAKGIKALSDAVLRFNEERAPIKHTVSVTVDNTYTVSSSLGIGEISEGSKKTFTFTAVSENDFTLELK